MESRLEEYGVFSSATPWQVNVTIPNAQIMVAAPMQQVVPVAPVPSPVAPLLLPAPPHHRTCATCGREYDKPRPFFCSDTCMFNPPANSCHGNGEDGRQP